MGRKKARIRYLVLGIICSAYAFLALIGIIWMLSRQPISEQNTAEYTATVTYVRHMNDQEDGPAVIYTEEYGDKITVNGRIQSRIYQKVDEEGNVNERVAYEVSINRVEAVKE